MDERDTVPVIYSSLYKIYNYYHNYCRSSLHFSRFKLRKSLKKKYFHLDAYVVCIWYHHLTIYFTEIV